MKVLFVGEMYPDVVHGISVSNYINCEILGEKFDVHRIEEKTSLNKISALSVKKVLEILTCCYKVFIVSRKKEFNFLYSVISTGILGLLKTIFYVYCFKVKGRNIILHIHRGDFTTIFDNRLKWLLLRILLRRVNKIICLTAGQQMDLERKLIKYGINIHVLSNTVLDEDKLLRTPLTEINSTDVSVLFLSNFFREKGVFEVIEAARCCPSLKFNLVGGNQAALQGVTLPQNVKLLGQVVGSDKIHLFSANDILLFPSWNEGQPLVLLESMAAGLPVIASKVGLITETLGDDYPFITEARNVHALVEAIHDLLDNDCASEMSIRLRKRYIECYSVIEHKKRLLHIFQSDVKND